MKRFFILFSILATFNAHAELLDKILAVVDDNVITLSMVERVKQNLIARRNISPFVYSKQKYSNKEISDIIINSHLIRSKLKEMNIIITDEHVESEIKSKEKALGLSRAALLNFLENNNTTFEEFFEITRGAIEFNQFNARVIAPLISVTDQEIKNKYYEQNSKDKRLAFKYNLVDFSLSKNKVKDKNHFVNSLKKYQTTGILPDQYSDLGTNVLGDITEDGLTSELNKLLKKSQEGQFTSPILLYGDYHVFFVKKKDLVESEDYRKQKNRLKGQIFTQKSLKVTDNWYKREMTKHYVKYFF
ncbi:SurA N-terminal domain-containing protein [Halobacteriovorax sp. GB3]|uniref:SurA N-terminal domain-containing protein n=1 Tax=Halobacteriovorax sp. GB3 TaxID=2719615 RepID=UPI00235F67E8|nr:SurA N-terminal domain-containing protein [Halobacteriovorax sp. GB3]MDD0854709.1 SurA N-terminal domain-containing protein [Halobacteriovorax sp. GB3]